MHYDLGNYGFQILFFFSIGFGGIAQAVAGNRMTRWLWLIAGTGWFIGGLVASEVLVGTMTVDQIQPIFDGLAYDEAFVGGLIGGLIAVAGTWYVTRRERVAVRA